MKIGQEARLPTLRKALDSKHGLRWLLLACTLLYGLLDSRPELLPGFETLLNRQSFAPAGMPVIAQDSVFARLLLPLTPRPLGLEGQHPKRLICLAPMKSSGPILPEALESAQGLHLVPQTLDTITCWEAHER